MLNDQRSLIKEKKKKYMSIVFGKNIINVLFIYIYIIYIYISYLIFYNINDKQFVYKKKSLK